MSQAKIENQGGKMTFIGIDPGQKGAVSILCDACTGVFDLFDMPKNIVNLYRKLKPGGSKYFCLHKCFIDEKAALVDPGWKIRGQETCQEGLLRDRRRFKDSPELYQ